MHWFAPNLIILLHSPSCKCIGIGTTALFLSFFTLPHNAYNFWPFWFPIWPSKIAQAPLRVNFFCSPKLDNGHRSLTSAKGQSPSTHPPHHGNNYFFPTFFSFFLLQNDLNLVKRILYDMGNSSVCYSSLYNLEANILMQYLNVPKVQNMFPILIILIFIISTVKSHLIMEVKMGMWEEY